MTETEGLQSVRSGGDENAFKKRLGMKTWVFIISLLFCRNKGYCSRRKWVS